MTYKIDPPFGSLPPSPQQRAVDRAGFAEMTDLRRKLAEAEAALLASQERAEAWKKLCLEVTPGEMGGTPDLFYPEDGWDGWDERVTKLFESERAALSPTPEPREPKQGGGEP